ncbi:MAG: hypothetical protein UX19_C0006G0023 [Candidatus Woesebacteria bacterium GW2011_GWA1_45_8]|uniref:Uncharacterized protein n=1 Tax=Candidatus Woesebacteria bacterium GW2011_GWA1_45_8 TaxID=1618559 RepID=A0A0G1MVG4_9BACT|nr:MAG: hypothetical protein UX19_C0006G0023 [Candidatus Woesebacteria bacterium GW2011_GWA1_45_8]
MAVGDGGIGMDGGTSMGAVRGERETSSRERFIDAKMEHFGPGAQAFPDFLASMFPESPDAKNAARRLIGWADTFLEHTRDWPILEIRTDYKDINPNLHIGFDRRKGQIYISGPYLELNLPLHVFRRVSAGKIPQYLDSGPEFVEFISKETAGYEEKLTIFGGGKVVYERTPVTTVE